MLSLGASRVIDYTEQDFTEGDETYDVVFDAAGNSPARAKKPLRKTGVYLNSLNKETQVLEVGVPGTFSSKELIEAGKVRAVIDRRYPLEEIVEAHTYVEEGAQEGHRAPTVA